MFAIHFACIADDGEVEYNLPTLSYSAITIGKTVWNSETIAKEYPDIIAEFEARIAALERGSGDEITLAAVTSANVVKADGKVTITAKLEDGTDSVTVIDLDENDVPTKITTNGVECPVTWEGF